MSSSLHLTSGRRRGANVCVRTLYKPSGAAVKIGGGTPVFGVRCAEGSARPVSRPDVLDAACALQIHCPLERSQYTIGAGIRRLEWGGAGAVVASRQSGRFRQFRGLRPRERRPVAARERPDEAKVGLTTQPQAENAHAACRGRPQRSLWRTGGRPTEGVRTEAGVELVHSDSFWFIPAESVRDGV